MAYYDYPNYPGHTPYPGHRPYPDYSRYQALVDLYPDAYRVIHPVVQREIFNLRSAYGPDYVPTRRVYDNIVERCYREVEPAVYDTLRRRHRPRKQQFDDDGGRLLRAFIGATLITGLLRGFGGFRRPFGGFGFAGPFGGFGGPFGGF